MIVLRFASVLAWILRRLGLSLALTLMGNFRIERYHVTHISFYSLMKYLLMYIYYKPLTLLQLPQCPPNNPLTMHWL